MAATYGSTIEYVKSMHFDCYIPKIIEDKITKSLDDEHRDHLEASKRMAERSDIEFINNTLISKHNHNDVGDTTPGATHVDEYGYEHQEELQYEPAFTVSNITTCKLAVVIYFFTRLGWAERVSSLGAYENAIYSSIWEHIMSGEEYSALIDFLESDKEMDRKKEEEVTRISEEAKLRRAYEEKVKKIQYDANVKRKRELEKLISEAMNHLKRDNMKAMREALNEANEYAQSMFGEDAPTASSSSWFGIGGGSSLFNDYYSKFH